ncbi:MAG: Nif3-like dinuclear metal center hexameric protein, partial [Firmicutes bacterium]|nr:Nif3-like dinuclear metal center hexameric protein [Bacillota bacterium]
MAKIKDFIDIMEEFAPSNFVAPEFLDNVGLLIGCPSWQAGTVYCCLDVTNQAIDEAIKHKASLIISHHPPIFKPINKITTCDVLGQKIIKLIQNGIGLYTSHTNLDFVKGGINEFVAKQIGLTDLKPLNAYIGEDEGWGRMGVLPAQTDCDSFCSH